MLYTGGTTGMPKGVMWRQDDLFARLNGGGFRRYPEHGGIDDVRAELAAGGAGMTLLPACPLMHGTGAFTAMECLSEGGHVVTLLGRQFDPVELLDTIEAGGSTCRSSWATPSPGRSWPHSTPSRAMGPVQPGGHHLVGRDVERGDQAGPPPPPPGHAPDRRLLFVGGAGHGHVGLVAPGRAKTAQFRLGPDVRVVDTEGRDIEAGSGQVGVLALGGRIPLGYYKDEAKSAATFRVIDGVRYSVPGDFAEIREDGSSTCSDVARSASTPAARRSTPRRSKRS